MSRSHCVAVSAAWIVALAFLFSSAVPAVLANGGDTTYKTARKTKKSHSEKKAAEKTANQSAAGKKADAEKSKGDEKKAHEKAAVDKDAEKFDDFDDEVTVPKKPEAKPEKSVAKPETKPAGKTAKVEEKTAHAAGDSAKKAGGSKSTVVRFSLNGEYPEGPSEPGLFADLQPSLGKLIERLDEAKADKEVAAVWLRMEDVELGRGKVNEVRAAIARLRKAGKPVYAELTSADTGAYLVASACDHVYMPSSGLLIMPGVRMEVTFYKGLLDKLGLKFDALRMGKYKGFVEPYSRESMSAPLRESLQSIVDDVYDDMVATIAKDRQPPGLPGQVAGQPGHFHRHDRPGSGPD